MGAGSFPGVKSGRGTTLTPHPFLVPWSRKSRAIPLLPLWAIRPVQSLSACTRVNFTLPLPVTFEFVAEMLTNQDQGILTEVNPTFTRFSAIFSLHSLLPTLRHYLPEYKTIFPSYYLKYGCHHIITQSNYVPTETASYPR